MKRGVVAEVCGNQAVVLTENGEFKSIRNNNYSVGQQVTLRKKVHSSFYAMAAGFILILLVGFGGFRIYYTPVDYVDIDINPSLRLFVNVFDRVIETKPLNDDANVLLTKTGDLSGDYRKCIRLVTESAKQLGYINEENKAVEINVVSTNDNITQDVEEYRKLLENDEVSFEFSVENREILEQAEAHDVSIGKLKAVMEYTDANGGTVEENLKVLKKEKNNDIRKSIEKIQNEEADKVQQNEQLKIEEELTKPMEQDAQKSSASDKKINNKTENTKTNQTNSGNSVSEAGKTEIEKVKDKDGSAEKGKTEIRKNENSAENKKSEADSRENSTGNSNIVSEKVEKKEKVEEKETGKTEKAENVTEKRKSETAKADNSESTVKDNGVSKENSSEVEKEKKVKAETVTNDGQEKSDKNASDNGNVKADKSTEDTANVETDKGRSEKASANANENSAKNNSDNQSKQSEKNAEKRINKAE